jgi:DNA mismatch endonuclease, patch repair protein
MLEKLDNGQTSPRRGWSDNLVPTGRIFGVAPINRKQRSRDEIRSHIMRSVKSRDTGPEVRVCSILWRAGHRYRLHYAHLPGKPDIVFPGKRKVVFVHGCFWHSHSCEKGRPPKSRAEYWIPKLKRNVQRDRLARKALRKLGWSSLVVWQCQVKNETKLIRTLNRYLAAP